MTERDYSKLLPQVNTPDATIFIRDKDGKYVWVNTKFQEDHNYTVDAVRGLTQADVFGMEAALPWQLSDAVTWASEAPTTTIESYRDPHLKKLRQYALTKFIAEDANDERYIVGIGVEVKPTESTGFLLAHLALLSETARSNIRNVGLR